MPNDPLSSLAKSKDFFSQIKRLIKQTIWIDYVKKFMMVKMRFIKIDAYQIAFRNSKDNNR